jgi:hypothetical protein
MTQIIGLTGLLGSGKSAVAKEFVKTCALNGVLVEILPFADPVKAVAYSMGWDGEKDEKGRRLLQLIGTECMRECIDPDGWVKLWLSKAHSSTADIVVADDCRFPNEEATIHELCGIMCRVEALEEVRKERGVVIAHTGHESESHQLDADITVYNNSAGTANCVSQLLEFAHRRWRI